MISEKKTFLSGYIDHNRNLHSKFHVPSFSSFDSELICPFNPHFTPSGGLFLIKSFLRGYMYRNKNLLSKFHVSSFNSFSSGLLVDVPSSPILPLQVVLLKYPFLVVTYNVIVTYIPNFTFLSSVIVALRWNVSQSVSFSFYIYIYIYI